MGWVRTAYPFYSPTSTYKSVATQHGDVAMSQQCTEQIDVYLPRELDERIEAQLGYADSKSGWLREAAREKLAREQTEK